MRHFPEKASNLNPATSLGPPDAQPSAAVPAAMTTNEEAPTKADVLVRLDKNRVGEELCRQIVGFCQAAIEARGVFSIALSGGSLPQLLAKLPATFEAMNVNPHWHQWHVLLADERCVPVDHADSNLGAIKRYLLSNLYEKIPRNHIYGLDQISLGESVSVSALEYEVHVKTVVDVCGGKLDLAVLGFGPDGHTCSLFPGHKLVVDEYHSTRLVLGITDSPKPPRNRITLTFHVLNQLTRNILVCGAGDSKAPILEACFHDLQRQSSNNDGKRNNLEATVLPKYPCCMVRPQDKLVYLVDDAAMGNLMHLAQVHVAASKDDLAGKLGPIIVKSCQQAMESHGAFTIALSGGSLPKVLGQLPQAFEDAKVDPQWSNWHVLLADERCVPVNDDESNLGAIQEHFLKHIKIPKSQVHGINQYLLKSGRDNLTQQIAAEYQERLVNILDDYSKGLLDLAVLGFGPDGHTCSLFPNHPLLNEKELLVASIDDSPKPPPKRITLTYKLLNEQTKSVIFCGAGDSKRPILEKVFSMPHLVTSDNHYNVPIQRNPAPFPCAAVNPLWDSYWVIDTEAMPPAVGTKSAL